MLASQQIVNWSDYKIDLGLAQNGNYKLNNVGKYIQVYTTLCLSVKVNYS